MSLHPYRTLTRRLTAPLALTALLQLAACGDEEPAPADTAEAAAEERPAAAEPLAQALAPTTPAPAPAEPILAPTAQPDDADEANDDDDDDAPATRAPRREAPARQAAAKRSNRRASADRLQVDELLIAHDVQNKMPVQPGLHYSTRDRKVWAWTALENPGDDTSITMVWKHRTREKHRVKLKVGHSKQWRTWSHHTLAAEDAGAWQVEVRDADERLLEVLEFWVKPDPAAKVAARPTVKTTAKKVKIKAKSTKKKAKIKTKKR